MADFVMELHCHLSDTLDDAAKKAVVEATGLAARDYMRSVAGGDVRSVNLRGTSPAERVRVAVQPDAVLERAAEVLEELGWGGLAAEVRLPARMIAGRIVHTHTAPAAGGQMLRHAHPYDKVHGYYEHAEDL